MGSASGGWHRPGRSAGQQEAQPGDRWADLPGAREVGGGKGSRLQDFRLDSLKAHSTPNTSAPATRPLGDSNGSTLHLKFCSFFFFFKNRVIQTEESFHLLIYSSKG